MIARDHAKRRKHDPRRAELFAAIDKLGVLPRRAGAEHSKSLGRWLHKHRNVEAAGLRLHAELDSTPKVWRYAVVPLESDAELSAELDRIADDTRAFELRERAAFEERLRKSRNPAGTLERALQPRGPRNPLQR